MDDLLDLDFNKPAPTSKPQANYGSGKTAFDYLAKSTAPTSSYSISNTRTTSPLQGQPPQVRTNGTSGGDAFSSLFGNTSTSTSTGTASGSTLSMAERLAKERATSPSFGASYNVNSRSSSPALQPIQQPIRNQSPSLSDPRSSKTPPVRSNAPSPAPVSNTTKKVSDPWDFDLLSSTVPPSTSSSTTDPLFDLGFETRVPPTSAPPSRSPALHVQSSHTATKSPSVSDEFDLLGAFSQPAKSTNPSPSPLPRPNSSSSSTTTRTTTNSKSSVISPPPEMLLKLSTELGFPLKDSNKALIEIFEKTGKFSLEDAVEVLMMNSSQVPTSESSSSSRRRNGKGRNRREVDEWGEEENVRIGRRRSWELEEEDQDQIHSRRRQQQHQQPTGAAEVSQARNRRPQEENQELKFQKDEREREKEVSDQLNAKVLQDQAQQALAQASKIGMNMFKSANAYWGAGKEALSKKLEEQRRVARLAAGLPATNGGGVQGGDDQRGGTRSDGRPKWWKEGMDEEDEDQRKSSSSRRNGQEQGEARTTTESSGFKDSDDEEAERPESVLPQRPPHAQPQPRQKAPPSSTDPAAEYRSPFRRAKAAPPTPQPVEADLLSGNVSQPQPSRHPTPPTSLPASRPSRPSPTSTPRPPPPSRPSISIPPSVLSAAISHKQTGNSQFKLGNYSSASDSYSLALESLPQQWIGRVLLLNNRAQSKLKNGEEKSAILDCEESIKILTCGKEVDVQSLERESQGLSREVQELAGGGSGGSGVDLRDQLGKSLGRRAKGFETTEKWKEALKDWEMIRKLGDEVVVRGAGGGKLVGEGVERCRKMIDPPSARPSSTQAPRSSTVTTTRTPTTSTTIKKKKVEVEGSGEAVKALQASQALQLAEEDLRLQLKDQVDSRILSWKSNKETNLRALIASLDQVLWEGLAWKKVGMNELITENQLKVRYVRAIAKVHPDKLNVGNTTVEQRMIAGAVFAALNEAWNATKA